MFDNKIVIQGGSIITIDDTLGDFTSGDILIDKGKIIEIAHKIEVSDAEVISADNMIVLPGFVDTHRHVWQTAMRSITANWSLMDYIRGIRFRAAGAYRPEDMYAAQYAGALEALNAGVTTVIDFSHNIVTPDHASEAIRGLNDAGIRALWCYGFNEPLLEPNPDFKNFGDRITLAQAIARDSFSASDGLLTFGIAIDDPPYMKGSMRQQEYHTARDLGVRITQHVNAMPRGNEPAEIMLLNEDGLLGTDICLVHMAYTTEEEWKIVADAGCSISFAPETELQMGMGMPPVNTLRRHKLLTSLGTDIVSNNSGDMFFPMRMLLQIERHMQNLPELNNGIAPNGVPIETREALRWGTINGAIAAGLDHKIGSLSPGKAADIIMIRTDDINLAGWNDKDPVSNVIMQAHPGNVDTVLVAGNVVKRDGSLVADVNSAVSAVTNAQQHVARIVEESGGFMPPPEKDNSSSILIQ